MLLTFLWSAQLLFTVHRVPKNAMQFNVVGKRWIWKLQHMTGQREINELHVPVGVPVKLVLTSEDVIHSFFVPAFRIKQDAIPGRYTTISFTPTKAGRYHLFCTEYCGTQHSGMIGQVIVREPAEFQEWLAGGAAAQSPAAAGEKLFKDLACATCHRSDTGARGPSLTGVFGSEVRLADGSLVKADESYVRESIVNPTARVVAGYQPVVALSTGTSFTGITTWVSRLGDGNRSRYLFADFNGDGKIDISYINTSGDVNVLKSTGSIFSELVIWADFQAGDDPTRFSIADFNGDGKTDVIKVTVEGDLRVALSTGALFTTVSTWVSNSGDGNPARYRFIDLDGDGMSDYFRVGGDGQLHVAPKDGPFPNLFTSILNGTGGQTKISYAPSTSYVNTQLPFAVQTVSSVSGCDNFDYSTTTCIGNSSTTEYE